MAFGKKPENLTRVIPYGGSGSDVLNRMGRAQQRTRTPRGASKRPYWANQFKPSETIPDTIRLIPGEYPNLRVDDRGDLYEEILPWYEYIEHYHGGLQKGGICSAGPHRMDRNKRDECYGCEIYWEDWQIRKDTGGRTPNRISARKMYVFNVLDMGTFFKADQYDNNGRPRINPKSGEPYWDWEKLVNPNDPAAAGKETRKGAMLTWAMGDAHFQALKGYGEHICQHCNTCGVRGDDPSNPVVITHAWACANEDCGHPIIRLSNTTLTPDQIAATLSTPMKCPQCGRVSYLKEIVDCGPSCGMAGKGLVPERASIFNVDMQVKRQRAPDSNQTQLIVLATSNPKPIGDAFKDIVKPTDLAARFTPTPLAGQAGLWNYVPRDPDPTGHAQPYNR